MAYTFDGRIRYSETGPDKKLTLMSLVDYFQDCSTFHSEDSGLGLDYLRQTDRAWMIVFWQIDIERLPSLCENVTTGTSAYEFKGFYGLRNFDMKDASGAYLAKANSVWVLMDMNSQKPCAVDRQEMAAYGPLSEKLDMEYLPRKIRRPSDYEQMPSFPVGMHHLDTNQHVNNGQYIGMAEEYLPKGFPIRRFCVEYCRQAHLHDEIFPRVTRTDHEVTVMLCGADEKPYAIVKFEA